jgi:hypothetical protein
MSLFFEISILFIPYTINTDECDYSGVPVLFNDTVSCQEYTASVIDVWSTGSITVTKENLSTPKKTCPIATLPYISHELAWD